MRTQALASNNPSATSREIWKSEDFLALVLTLDLPDRERTSFFDWVMACTDSEIRGSQIFLCRSIETGALALGICKTTMRKRVRRWEALGLIERHPRPWYRTILHTVNLERMRLQDWPDGLCPRCKHKHRSQAKCACVLDQRVWRRSGCRERMVQRDCQCAARQVLPPIRPMRPIRRGPQRVESSAAPASPTPVPAAASPQSSPAAPVRVQIPLEKFVPPMNAPPPDPPGQRKLTSREAGKLMGKMDELIKGRTHHTEAFGGYGYDLRPDDPRYRKPESKSNALVAACLFLGLPYWTSRTYLERCGWKFDEAAELRGAGHEVPEEEEPEEDS